LAQTKSADGFCTGLGKTTRKGAVEDCWLAKRGKPPIKAHDVRELIVSSRREHSRKPDEQYGRIERLVDGPYLEMFARQARPGWIAWGDEVSKFQAVEPPYDADRDIRESVAEGFRAIKARQAAGGPGWISTVRGKPAS
jgi:N6-adenosine-specific RNA methylase IME4